MTPEERAAFIGAQFPANGITYTYLGILFAVSGCVVTGPAVQVSVIASTGKGANKVYLPLGDGIFRFVNPPLMVPDGGTEVVTPPHGDPYTLPTFTRDDLAAAQAIVYDAVTACARTHGWTP
jgi:hypothetical protein